MEIKDLKFARLTDPHNADLIPRTLIDQAKDKNFTTERFFTLLPFILSDESNIIGVFVNKDNIIKGFLYTKINIFNGQFAAVILSMDKEYQGSGGKVSEYATEVIRNIPKMPEVKTMLKKLKLELLPMIQASTTHPEVYERRGWKRARSVTMELPLEKQNGL